MPLINPEPPYDTDERMCAALCAWREARGEPVEAKIGVIWVLKNRTLLSPLQGFKRSIVGNVLKPWAFSSFMSGDPNALKYPEENDPSWTDCLTAYDSAISSESDPTLGAVFYFSPPLTLPPHAWGAVNHTVDLGRLHFYALPT